MATPKAADRIVVDPVTPKAAARIGVGLVTPLVTPNAAG